MIFKRKQYTISYRDRTYYVWARTKWGARRKFERETGYRGGKWIN